MRLYRLAFVPLFLLVMFCLSLTLNTPPAPVSLDAADTEFSAQRAMQHLTEITRAPHPTGSAEIKRVKQYLIAELEALGLDVEVQRQEVIYDYGRRSTTRMATIENIIATKSGLQPQGKKLALMAHYDSRENTLGASDDGSGVVTILETLRALQHLPALSNDLVIILTDGEEAGLFGAQAFVEHPMAKDIGLVLNFEARGSHGPVMMFETSVNNAALISALSDAAPYPVADSLSYAIYQRMPNDTDLSVTKAAGLPGLNFAFTGGHYDYHTMGDSAENISLATLQHAGSYALALTQHFGQQALPLVAEQDAIYFTALPGWLVHYSFTWAYIFAALTLVVFVAVVIADKRKGTELNWLQVILNSLLLLLQLAWLVVIIQATHRLIGGDSRGDSARFFVLFAAQPQLFIGYSLFAVAWIGASFQQLQRGIFVPVFILAAAATFILLVSSATLILPGFAIIAAVAILSKWHQGQQEAAWLEYAGFALWFILLGASLYFMPEASHLLTWPLLLVLVLRLLLNTFWRSWNHYQVTLVSILGASLALLWWVNLADGIYGAVGLRMPGVSSIMLFFPLCLASLAITDHLRKCQGLTAIGALILASYLVLSAPFDEAFDDRYKKPDSLFYFVDLSENEVKHYWASADKELADWSRSLFESGAQPANFFSDVSGYVPGSKRGWWLTSAPPIQLAKAEVLHQSSALDLQARNRQVEMHLNSKNRAEYIDVFFQNPERILSAKLNGKDVPLPEVQKDWWNWRYYGMPAQGVTLTLNIKGDAPLQVRYIEAAWRLPEFADFSLPVRPEDTMARFYTYSDATVMYKKLWI